MIKKALVYSDWNNIVSETRNDFVFYERNKLYGAYWIRINHNRLMILAFLISAGLFTLAITSPLIYRWIKGNAEDQQVLVNREISEWIDPSTIKPDEPLPQPPPPPHPPVVQQIKFIPPVVVDIPVLQDERPPLQTDLTNKIIGTQHVDSGSIEPPPNVLNVETKGTVTEIPNWVQEMPMFPGGDQKLLEFIQKNLRYPALAREYGIKGRVTIRFVVDENGKVKMVNVPKGMGVGGGCDEEATRVISMLPDWQPGKQNGHAVSVWYTVPVVFQLQ